MTQKNRWNDAEAPKLAIGTLFWVDADSTIRQVTPCDGCKKVVLAPWTSQSDKKILCKNCAKKL